MRKLATLAVLIAVFSSPVLSSPAEACSCALPGDLAEWVDNSQAVFVGTMIDRDADGPFDGNVTYVFEVEEWIKGDIGPVVEVTSGQGDADCGYGDQIGHRIGAAIFQEGGVLYGNGCLQVDPDDLLEVRGNLNDQPPVAPLTIEWSPPDASPETRLIATIAVGVVVLGLIGLAITTLRPRRAPTSDQIDD